MPSGRLHNEAKETSGVTSALLLEYVERAGGRSAVTQVLERCGLTECEAELRDEGSWFSWETKIALFEATAAVLEKPDFVDEMAAGALDGNVAGSLKVALRTLGSPRFVLRNIVRANARFNRSHKLELLNLEQTRAKLRFSEISGGNRYHELDCHYTAGLLAVIPGLFGLPRAEVNHVHCAPGPEGFGCTFDLEWCEHPSTARLTALTVASASAGAALSARLLPRAVPVVGLAAMAGLGKVIQHRWAWNREQLRHLRRQLEDSDEVASQLFASLQELVSDLRLEEVVAKVTTNAQVAVGGRDFLLLVREGERMVCQSASALPPGAIEAVERWAGATRAVSEGPVLIDDVAQIAPLAPLAELDDPLCSLASAPLTFNGEILGLLVALGGQQQSFLSRDTAVLQSYAAQVSIALSNARLYQSQRSLAAQDPLTGLLNHRSFHEALGAELERWTREDTCGCVVLIDLDHFKQVNDQEGHVAGDRVLRAAAEALTEAAPRADLAFRIGGDEFALLLPGLSEPEATAIAARCCEAISGIDARVGASAGVACATRLTAKESLLAEADSRLYAAKHGPARTPAAELLSGWGLASPEAVELLAAALDMHHGDTLGHSHAVAGLAVAVAARMGLDAPEREFVRQVGLLHDLGKLSISRAVLDKPARLTEAEWRVVRRHPADGAVLLRRVPGLERLAAAVEASHERCDGAGYPAGLAAEEIPLAARVVAACDAFEAMTGERPYRDPLTHGEAIAELQACAGSQFDSEVVDALVAELTALSSVA